MDSGAQEQTTAPVDPEDRLRACVAIESWVAGMLAGRPYADTDAVLARGRDLAAAWTDAEVEEALAGHPRIGERTTSAHSTREQSGVGSDADTAARLADGNRRYEERFGRIYLVRAAGRDAEEMLALLEQRLGHDDETERRVVREQLAEITLLRLTDAAEDLVDGSVEGPVDGGAGRVGS